MEGLERFEKEVLEMNNNNILAIFEYLKTRTDLYEKFNNSEKSIKQMYKFICEKAKKQSINNVAMINGKMVYLWAVTYFNKINSELGLNETPKVMPPSAKEVIKNIEKKEKESETKKDNLEQITLFQEVSK